MGRSLKRPFIWVVKNALRFSNPISIKTQFLTPDYPKRVLTDVYRFNIQQCTTKNRKQQHQSAIQLILINFQILQNLTLIPLIPTNIMLNQKSELHTIIIER